MDSEGYAQLRERLATKRARYTIQRDDTLALVELDSGAAQTGPRVEIVATQTTTAVQASAVNEGIDSWEAEAIRTIAAAYEDEDAVGGQQRLRTVEEAAAAPPVDSSAPVGAVAEGIDSWEAEAIRSIAAAYEDDELQPVDAAKTRAVAPVSAVQGDVDSWEAEAIRSIAAAYDEDDEQQRPVDDAVAPHEMDAQQMSDVFGMEEGLDSWEADALQNIASARDHDVEQHQQQHQPALDRNATANNDGFDTPEASLDDHKMVFDFVVDSFSERACKEREGRKATVAGYVLSHFHSDHYGGMRKSWNHGQIYCTKVIVWLCVCGSISPC